jgi:ribosomal protein S18 acetylase RimI-like enzyme
MAGLRVRRARLDDAQAIARIVAEVAQEGFLGAEPPVDLDERTERQRELISSDLGSWVLEHDDAIVGYLILHSRVRGVLSLGMAVLPAARSSGGGRALLQAALEHAPTTGAHKLDLEVWLDNARAIAFYADAGFEVEGLRRDHYLRRDGRLRSTLIMARRLRVGELA